ncbi:MAG: hypothetical protein K1W10_07080 [Lachnospiraceae bacterium]
MKSNTKVILLLLGIAALVFCCFFAWYSYIVVDRNSEGGREGLPDDRTEFPIVKDTTPNMMNPRLYTTSYNKPQGQQFDDTAVLSFIKLQYT